MLASSVVISVLSVGASTSDLPPEWRWLSKSAYFIGLAGVIGVPLVHLLAVRPALLRHTPPDVRTRADRAMRRVVGASAVLFALVYPVQLASTVARGLGLSLADGFSPAAIVRYLSAPATGDAWLGAGVLTAWQVAFAGLTVVLLLAAAWAGSARTGTLLSGAVVTALLISLVRSLPQESADLSAEHLVDQVLIQGHIIGGSVWLGGLAALAALTWSRNHIKGASAEAWGTVWRRFSVMAMVAVGVIMVSGAWLTWMHVGSPSQLLTTTFGLVLTAKVLLVAALVGFGGFNQLRLLPRVERLRRAGHDEGALRLAVTHFGRIVTAEVALGALVLLAVGLLTGSARKQAGDAAAVPDWTIYAWGTALVVGVVAAFLLTARIGAFLATRPLAEPEPA